MPLLVRASPQVSLAQILPERLAFFELFGEADPETLFPEEGAMLGRAAEKRVLEFARGRTCARRALRELGFAPAPLLRETDGAPSWPAGVVGSISHCAGFAGAVVGLERDWASIGMDAEVNKPLPEHVFPAVSSETERDQIARLPDLNLSWDRLLFSIKESVFKARKPFTTDWLDFSEAEVTIDAADQTFAARFTAPERRGASLGRGRYTFDTEHLLTVLVVASGDQNEGDPSAWPNALR